jgi:hypothetical protein
MNDRKYGMMKKSTYTAIGLQTRGYGKLKVEALDRILWRTDFGKGYGPVIRQST